MWVSWLLTMLLAPLPVASDLEWGLDHGTWSVLAHLYPGADIPVVHLSLDSTRPPAWHAELARHLGPLRDEGVLLLGSGNVVHNLRRMDLAHPECALDWAARFSARVGRALVAADLDALVDFVSEDNPDEDARLAVPTPEPSMPTCGLTALPLPVLTAPRAEERIGSICSWMSASSSSGLILAIAWRNSTGKMLVSMSHCCSFSDR